MPDGRFEPFLLKKIVNSNGCVEQPFGARSAGLSRIPPEWDTLSRKMGWRLKVFKSCDKRLQRRGGRRIAAVPENAEGCVLAHAETDRGSYIILIISNAYLEVFPVGVSAEGEEFPRGPDVSKQKRDINVSWDIREIG
jgi:hypothetical protein